MFQSNPFLLCDLVSLFPSPQYSLISSVSGQYSLCQCDAHLPGLTAPPAGISGDVHAPAARLPGQESELPDSTANETPQVDGRSPARGIWGWTGPEEEEEHPSTPPEGQTDRDKR